MYRNTNNIKKDICNYKKNINPCNDRIEAPCVRDPCPNIPQRINGIECELADINVALAEIVCKLNGLCDRVSQLECKVNSLITCPPKCNPAPCKELSPCGGNRPPFSTEFAPEYTKYYNMFPLPADRHPFFKNSNNNNMMQTEKEWAHLQKQHCQLGCQGCTLGLGENCQGNPQCQTNGANACNDDNVRLRQTGFIDPDIPPSFFQMNL
jgi:hypothetical protein